MLAQKPSNIGVFDSGVGGLTVVDALRKVLPDETIHYLGDTARVPYGTRSAEVVRLYAQRCARFLLEDGAKCLVIACNTASAHALDAVRELTHIPVIGVIEPGAQSAVQATHNQRIGIICTESTRQSGSYARAIQTRAPQAQIHTVACPLLVPLAEEGWIHHPATRLIAAEYLQPLLDADIDTLVLGCTHYPLLTPVLAQIAGPKITLINSAQTVAENVKSTLDAKNLRAKPGTRSADRFFATDLTERLHRVGSNFLGGSLPEVTWVDLT